MNQAISWIIKVALVASVIMLLGILSSGNGVWLDGFVSGALLSLLSLMSFKYTANRILKDDDERSPLFLLIIMPFKLLVIGAIAYVLVVFVNVSAIGMMIGLGNVPIAVALHGTFGKVVNKK